MDDQMSADNIKGLIGHTKKSGMLFIIIIGLVAGIVLLVIGNTGSGRKVERTVPDGVDNAIIEYQKSTEQKIEALVGQVRGAGEVSAAVRLDGGFEYVYATDISERNGSVSSEYILVGNGSNESAVYLRLKTPEISGIGIVCTGGDDPAVRKEIINLLSAAFGIGTNKIYVTGKS